jgi:hypothetical protein
MQTPVEPGAESAGQSALDQIPNANNQTPNPQTPGFERPTPDKPPIEPDAMSAGQSALDQIPIANNRTPNFELPTLDKPPSAEVAVSIPDLLPPSASPLLPLAGQGLSPKPKDPLTLNSAIGTIEVRTPAEEVEFRECETIVGESWAHVARAGEALVRIRDKELYKNEYDSFEAYCKKRWGFGYFQARRYISAAAVQKSLATTPGMPVPECEAQIRPLIGLPAELAQEAWLNALSWSRGGHVSARLVTRAVKQVLKNEQPALAAESNANKQQRYRLRQSVRAGFQELLTLLLGSAERGVLIAKVQEIQRLLDPLLTPKKTKA